MYSVLKYWNQEEIKRTILFLSLEEALFYEPEAEKGIREFVVTSIRNSKLEVAASVNCEEMKKRDPLSNEQIRAITGEAVKFFGKVDFKELQQEAETNFINVYDVAKDKYPLAWLAIQTLANMETEVLDWTQDVTAEKESVNAIKNLREADVLKCKGVKVITDGYSLEFDEHLTDILEQVVSGEMPFFYVDCFKMISRNFEKVLHVVQILLEARKALCTYNYYISRSQLEKRKKIVRAAHDEDDIVKHLEKINNVPECMKQCLQVMSGLSL